MASVLVTLDCFHLVLVFITKTCPCDIQRFYTNKNFISKILIFFLFLLQNIDCGYSLEPPRSYNQMASVLVTLDCFHLVLVFITKTCPCDI